MFTLPIPAKIKAVVGLIGAVAIVLTGVAADNVLNLNDLTTYGAQLVEAFGTYAAIFKSRRNREPDEILYSGGRFQRLGFVQAGRDRWVADWRADKDAARRDLYKSGGVINGPTDR